MGGREPAGWRPMWAPLCMQCYALVVIHHQCFSYDTKNGHLCSGGSSRLTFSSKTSSVCFTCLIAALIMVDCDELVKVVYMGQAEWRFSHPMSS